MSARAQLFLAIVCGIAFGFAQAAEPAVRGHPWSAAAIATAFTNCSKIVPSSLAMSGEGLCECYVTEARVAAAEPTLKEALARDGWPLRSEWSQRAYATCLTAAAEREHAACLER